MPEQAFCIYIFVLDVSESVSISDHDATTHAEYSMLCFVCVYAIYTHTRGYVNMFKCRM